MPDSFPGGWEWVDLYALNQEIIGEATDPYEVTLRIERYLRTFFEYSLTPPSSDYSSPYSAFLVRHPHPATASILPGPWPCSSATTAFRPGWR